MNKQSVLWFHATGLIYTVSDHKTYLYERQKSFSYDNAIVFQTNESGGFSKDVQFKTNTEFVVLKNHRCWFSLHFVFLIFNLWKIYPSFPLYLFKFEWKVPASVQSLIFLALMPPLAWSLMRLSPLLYCQHRHQMLEWGESRFYCRTLRPSLGRKMEKYAVWLLSVFLLSHMGVLRTHSKSLSWSL